MNSTRSVLWLACLTACLCLTTVDAAGSTGASELVTSRRLFSRPSPSVARLASSTDADEEAEDTAQAMALMPDFSTVEQPRVAVLTVADTVPAPELELDEVDDETLCEMCPEECMLLCYCTRGECVDTRPVGGSSVTSGTCATCDEPACAVFWWC